MTSRNKILTAVLLALTSVGSSCQTSLAAKNEDALASAADIRQVAAQLALCPEITDWVKHLMDERHGLLTEADVAMIHSESASCQQHYQSIPYSAAISLAYSALTRQFDRQPEASTIKARHQAELVLYRQDSDQPAPL